MFLGQYTPAIAAAEELIATMPDALLRIQSPPMADFLEGYLSMKQHVLVRFGKWHEIIAQELPQDRELYCSTRRDDASTPRAVAHSALGEIAEAERREPRCSSRPRRACRRRRCVHNNKMVNLLDVAEAMLDGELEYRRGNSTWPSRICAGRSNSSDGLPYDEPWGWMQPTRHALGALLLEQGRIEEAEAVYRADLGFDGRLSRACQHPDNVWSLHGLHECLVRRGETIEQPLIKQRLDLAQARAEVPIKASCFCRRMDLAAA